MLFAGCNLSLYKTLKNKKIQNRKKRKRKKRHFCVLFCPGRHQPVLFQGNLSLIGISMPILLALGTAGLSVTVLLFKLSPVFPAENKINKLIKYLFSLLISLGLHF